MNGPPLGSRGPFKLMHSHQSESVTDDSITQDLRPNINTNDRFVGSQDSGNPRS